MGEIPDNLRNLFRSGGSDDDGSDVPLETSYRAASVTVLKIDGAELNAQIVSVELKQPVDGHHHLKVLVHLIDSGNEDFVTNPGDSARFLGKTLSLSVKVTNENVDIEGELTFTGIVTQVQLRSTIGSVATLEIHGASPTIAMDGGKRNKIYDESRVNDAFSGLLGPYAISKGEIDDDGKSLNNQVQYRETDYAFLMRLATSCGLFARYDGSKFIIGKASASNAVTLAWRQTLGGFSLGLGVQQREYETKSFDLLETTVARSDTGSVPLNVALSEFSQTSADVSKEIFSIPGFYQINPPGDSQSVDNALKVVRNQSLGQMIDGYGVSINPTVKTGECVQVSDMGDFDGQYFVTSVTHRIDAGGYNNSFFCTPLDVAHPRQYSRRPHGSHIQSGIVTDNQDPENLGRVKVKFAWAEDQESVWARIAMVDAGEQRGLYSIPDIGDEVLVAFERGDTSQPVILGSLWNNSAKPHAEAPDPDNMVKMWVTRSGNMFYMTDIDNEQEIRLLTGDTKNSIVLKANGPEIIIQSEGGNITLKGANIKFETDEKIEMKSGSDLTMESGANMKLKAGANLEATASGNVKLQGSGQVEVKGAMIKLN